MNTNELSYLSPEDYFRDYNDESLSTVLADIISKYGKAVLSDEELLKQELKNSAVDTMDIYKLILISKCHGFNKLITDENINSIIDLERVTSNIFTQTKLNKADIMRLGAALFIALGMIEKPGIKNVVEKTLESIGTKHYIDNELKSNAFTLKSSEYKNKTLDYFEKVFQSTSPDVDSISDEELRSLEALLINGIPKAKYYTACYILSAVDDEGAVQRAVSLLAQAADEGDTQAAAKLADYYYYKGTACNDYDSAYKLYTGIGALALNKKRRENLLGLFNQRLYYKQVLNFSVVLYAVLTLSMVFPLSLNTYPNLTVPGILLSIVSLGILVLGFVINRLKPYFNIQFIPAALFTVWFFDILIRLLG